MSGAEAGAAAFPIGADVETVEDLRSGHEDGPLYRVVGVQGVLRDVRRIDGATGALDGIEVRFLAAELRPARSAMLRRCAARRLRAALAEWERAVDADDEDVDTLAGLVDSAEALADLVLDTDGAAEGQGAAVAVCGFVSDLDGAHVVQVDTTGTSGRVRVIINDGAIYDGDPNTDEPPGAHYGGPGGDGGGWMWNVRSADGGDARCSECGAAADHAVSSQHGPACSLHPDNCVGAQRGVADCE